MDAGQTPSPSNDSDSGDASVPDGRRLDAALEAAADATRPGDAQASVCDPADAAMAFDASPDALNVYAIPPAVALGTPLYVAANWPIHDLEVRIDGVLACPEYVQEQGVFGLYPLPLNATAGEVEIEIRARDSSRGQAPVVRTSQLTEPWFVDVSSETGLQQSHNTAGWPSGCEEDYTGIAAGDYDNDGDIDFYLGNYGAQGRLMRNDGPAGGGGLPQFAEVTEQVGLAGLDLNVAAVFVDYDNDGDQDLFVGRRGTNRVMRNQLAESGEASFVDATAALGLGLHEQRSTGFGFGDYDNDGDLDLYVANHTWCHPSIDVESRAGDHFYRNDGSQFTEVTPLLGSVDGLEVGLTFIPLFLDVDRDGDQDLFAFHDDVSGHSGPSRLWRNDGAGAGEGDWLFTDVSVSSGVYAATRQVNVMGAAVGDLNGDGYPEIATSSIRNNVLMQHSGELDFRYEDVGRRLDIRRGTLPWRSVSVTWGTHFLDYDNDTLTDLFHVGGPITNDDRIPNALFHNQGPQFEDVTWSSGLADMGHGKASSLVDLDRDGLLDIVVATWDGPLRVHRNVGTAATRQAHWLTVELEGTLSNRSALGAVVELHTASPEPRVQNCFMTSRPSLAAGGEQVCHFGLGDNATVDSLQVHWPQGESQLVSVHGVDRRLRIVQPTLPLEALHP